MFVYLAGLLWFIASAASSKDNVEIQSLDKKPCNVQYLRNVTQCVFPNDVTSHNVPYDVIHGTTCNYVICEIVDIATCTDGKWTDVEGEEIDVLSPKSCEKSGSTLHNRVKRQGKPSGFCTHPGYSDTFTVTLTGTATDDIATYVCNSGYVYASGSLERTCKKSGKWNGQEPTCDVDCGTPPTAQFANATVTSATTATYTCFTGYESADTLDVSCSAAGWTATPTCTLKDCGGTLPSITNGQLSLTVAGETTYGSTALLTCSTQFTGNFHNISCLDTGLWDTAATCTPDVDCGATLPTVPNGQLVLTTTGQTSYGSTATLTCSTGYDANVATVSCLDTGSWQTTATCTIKDCGATLPTVTNGQLILTTAGQTSYGSTATLTCSTGYDANAATVSCLDTGAWSTTATCTIKDCGATLPTVTNGQLTLTTAGQTSYSSTATLTCSTGYDANGATVSCLDTGAWETTATCTIKDCGATLPTVTNGQLTLTTAGQTSYGSTATLACSTGYDANAATVSCLDTGAWATTSTCTIKDCGATLPTVTDGQLTLTTAGQTSFGSTATLACSTGYDANAATVSCLDTGAWATTSTCTIKDCGATLPTVTNGQLTLATGGQTSYGSTATLTCSTGYGANVATVSCLDTGAWATTSTCTIKDCGATLPTVTNGQLTLATGSQTSYGSTATLTCSTGYDANVATVSCLDTGAWATTSTCTIKDCGATLPTVTNGQLTLTTAGQTSYGSTATLACSTGYDANAATVSCLDTGAWATTSTCTIKDCGATLPTVTNGQLTLTTAGQTSYGSTATLACSTGYGANAATVSCLDTGAWATTSTCTIKDCGATLPTVTNGQLTLTTAGQTSYGSTATLACSTGYDANAATVSCLDTGAWATTSTCTIKDCGATLPTVTDGQLTLTTAGQTSFGSTATLACSTGYDANAATVSCLDTGAWATTSTCTIKDCGATLPTVTNGQLTLATGGQTSYGSTATLTCSTGYDANVATVSCLDTGAWATTSTCTIKDCGATLPTVTNGQLTLATGSQTSYGSTATLTCSTGYDANVATVSCLDTGAWATTSTCTIKDCGATLPTVTNGQLTLTTAGQTSYGSTATLACSTGYGANAATVSCLDTGAWATTSTCTIKDCGGTLPTVTNGQLTLTTAGQTSYGSTATLTCSTGYDANAATVSCLDTGAWATTSTCTIKDCGGTLPTVTNGQLTLTTAGQTSYGSTATLACSTGYNANAATVSCLDTGAWATTSTCTVKDCGATLPTVTNGQLTLTTAGQTSYGSTAGLTCSNGYDSNVVTVSCLENGFWDTNAVCSMNACGTTLPTVTNGQLTLTTAGQTSHGSTANLTCSTGYDANVATVSCLANGDWETTAICTIKDCGATLPTVTDGHLTLTTAGHTNYGSTATLACSTGYDANVATVSCLDTGAWATTSTCTIKDCGGTLPTVTNGQLSLATGGQTSYGSTATLACSTGYDANAATVSCLDTGAWATTSTCTIKDCGATLPTVTDGQLTLTTAGQTSYGSTATLACSTGYDANAATVSCLDTGAWATTSTCTVKDCGATLPTVTNGQLTLTTAGQTSYGSTAGLTCSNGYDPNVVTVSCLENGFWDRNAVCSMNACGTTLPTVTNGQLTLTTAGQTSHGSTANLTCSTGYDANVATVSCLANGDWETTATCTIKDCGATLPTVTDGHLTLTTAGQTNYGSTATLACSTGYDANVATVSCLDTGAWATTSTCTIKDCGAILPTVTDGQLTLTTAGQSTYGSTATLTCSTGYDANVATVSCLDTGAWATTSTCTIKDCGGTLPTVTNGQLTLAAGGQTSYGSSATLTCSTGYDANAATVSCLDTGAWATTSTCTIKDCGATLPTVTDGQLTLTTAGQTSYGSTATLACSTGYDANAATVSCLDTGAWATTSTCTVKDCGATLPTVTNGQLTLTTAGQTSYGSTAGLTCSNGYDPNVVTVSCLENGFWDTNAVCSINACGTTLPTVTNGQLTLTTAGQTSHGSTANLTCSTGYDANVATVSCLANGDWETTAICTIKDCGATLPTVTDGHLTLTTAGQTNYGSTATLACSTGYDANVATVSCLHTGAWATTSTCTIKDCGAILPTVTDGQLTLTTAGQSTYGSTATLACSTGYDANAATVSCLDTGAWATTSTCTRKDCGATLPTVTDGQLTLTTAGQTSYGSTATLACSTGYDANAVTVSCLDTGAWATTSTCTIKDCGATLPTVTNGQLTLATGGQTNYGSTATLACSTGYDANAATVSCLDTGAWATTSTCTIKDCGATLPTVTDGQLTLTTAGQTSYGSTATLACSTGYDANAATVSCLDTGAWATTSTCTVKDCGATLPTVTNGQLTLTTAGQTSYGSTASLKCSNGYDSNVVTVSCLENGFWDTNAVCSMNACGTTLPTVTNGQLTLTTAGQTNHGSTANLTCSTGYDANVATVSCLANGDWETTAICTIKDCGATLPPVTNGQLTLTTAGQTNYGSTATLACSTGYDVNVATVSCLDTGAWATTSSCTIKDCGGTLPTVTNGQLSLATGGQTSYGSTATLTCSTGYDSNVATVSCLDTGSWGTTATCTVKDCGATLPTVTNGQLTLTTGGQTSYGSTATLTCSTGYDPNAATVSCLDTGAWATTSTCTIKDCGPTLPTVTDGQLTLTTGGQTSYGSTATLTCSTGYDSNVATVSCLDTGSWGTTATCTVKDCGATLPTVTNGQLTLTTGGQTSYGSTATLTCSTGYDPNAATVSCLDTGAWATTSTCTIKDCGATLPTVTNGQLTLATGGQTNYGSTATLACSTGYDANAATVSCLDTGAWATTSTCTIKDCGATLPTVTDGQLTLTTAGQTSYGSTATLACSTGYYANAATVSCLDTGAWATTSTCTVKDCGATLPTVTNGQLTLTTAGQTSYGSTASLKCSNGYDSNVVTVSCLENGFWDTNAVCSMNACGTTLPTVTNGQLTLTTAGQTNHGSTANLTCSTGYDANVATVSCLANGDWETTAICTIKDCGATLPPVTNGQLTLTTAGQTNYGSTATLACSTGYDVNVATVSCLDTGAWATTSSCTIKDCGGTLPTVTNGQLSLATGGQTSYGSTATLTCSTGYDSNVATVSCLDTGSWGTTATCTVKDCGATLPTVTNGQLTLTTGGQTSYGSTATLTCSTGYDPNAATVSCLDTGAWATTSTCTIKDCGPTLPTVTDGQLTLTTGGQTSYGSTATLACSTGYDANAATVSCLDTGAWATTSTCTVKDCGATLPTVTDGQLTLTTAGQTSYGSTAALTCSTGYDANVATVSCLDTGAWATTSTCTIKDCGATLPPVTNGQLTLTAAGQTSYGSTAYLTCSSGFAGTSETVTCLGTGAWDTTQSCRNISTIQCPTSLPTVVYGSLTLIEAGNTSYDSLANLSCSLGYDGNMATVSCLATGLWDSSASCTIRDCGSTLPSVGNGSLILTTAGQTSYGNTATLTCSTGYDANVITVSCLATGSWDTTATCTIKDCGATLPTVANGQLNLTVAGLTTYGSTATMSCSTGYIPTSSSVLCLDTGLWDTSPNCQLVGSAAATQDDESTDSSLDMMVLVAIIVGVSVVAVATAGAVLYKVKRKYTLSRMNTPASSAMEEGAPPPYSENAPPIGQASGHAWGTINIPNVPDNNANTHFKNPDGFDPNNPNSINSVYDLFGSEWDKGYSEVPPAPWNKVLRAKGAPAPPMVNNFVKR